MSTTVNEKPAPILPASTAVVLRDGEAGLQALILKRKSKGGNGAWVFPGGKVEPQDRAQRDEELAIAIAAACRETREEAGIALDPNGLQMISHWTTPPEAPKRFYTWFFIADCPGQDVTVDNDEMMAHRWVEPGIAVAEHRAGALKIMPPTLVTLTELACCADVAAARRFYAARDIPWIAPRMVIEGEEWSMLYTGDAGYESGDLNAPGRRNRSWLRGDYWEYESSDLDSISF